MEYKENESGYIVYKDGLIPPLTHGIKKWYPTYDDAISAALEFVRQQSERYKDDIDDNTIIVYEGSKELLRRGHSLNDGGQVVFLWQNYYNNDCGY